VRGPARYLRWNFMAYATFLYLCLRIFLRRFLNDTTMRSSHVVDSAANRGSRRRVPLHPRHSRAWRTSEKIYLDWREEARDSGVVIRVFAPDAGSARYPHNTHSSVAQSPSAGE